MSAVLLEIAVHDGASLVPCCLGMHLHTLPLPGPVTCRKDVGWNVQAQLMLQVARCQQQRAVLSARALHSYPT